MVKWNIILPAPETFNQQDIEPFSSESWVSTSTTGETHLHLQGIIPVNENEKENILILISSLIFHLSEPEEKDTVKLSQGNCPLWFFGGI